MTKWSTAQSILSQSPAGRFNVKNKVWGNLFGGRFKAILVQSGEGDYLATLSMEQTCVPQKWIVPTLSMGSAPYVSRIASEMKNRLPRDKKRQQAKQRIIRFIT